MVSGTEGADCEAQLVFCLNLVSGARSRPDPNDLSDGEASLLN